MVGLVTLLAMLALVDLRLVQVTLPAMVALGPLMVAQYLFWARRLGTERTTWQYQQAEPRHGAERRRRRRKTAQHPLDVANVTDEGGALRGD